MAFDIEMIENLYAQIPNYLEQLSARINRPLTLTEKILYIHFNKLPSQAVSRGDDYADFQPDRVAMQDATAQMALLQFLQAGRSRAAVPSTVHCDHLIKAKEGSEADLAQAKEQHKEVYDFLRSVAQKYGIGFWEPGAGIIHQVLLENYAFPGGLMIGTDSHTVNAGGLGMVAVGVGGADAVDVMAGMPWELKFPKITGVKLTGQLNGWTAPKDIILKIADLLTVKGGTGHILEYFGEGAGTISCTGKATICNMGAEIGATTSLFGYDRQMKDYLHATNRGDIANLADGIHEHLTGDAEVYAHPEHYFDRVIEIDLNTLEPYVNGPFSPDKGEPLSNFQYTVKENQYPEKLHAGLIGSCTNSSYEDITRSISLIRQANEKNLTLTSKYLVTPGSQMIHSKMEQDGLKQEFQQAGAKITANACGPCIGQWERTDISENQINSIVTSFNRNFAKRNDGNPNTYAFVASPEMVTAFALAGRITFNPLTDTLTNKNGEHVKLNPPEGLRLPADGFQTELSGYQPPADDGKKVDIQVKPDSDRIQLLEPFDEWNGKDLNQLPLLIKVKGKCTTDHISMAGPWLKYRGHLENISDNLLIGATNYFTDQINSVKNQITGRYEPVPQVAKAYKKAGIQSVIIGDENYGEGSSREHAAMEPRYAGVRVVLVRSFARIHETNLKKQGILALTFTHKEDYDKVREDDTIDVLGLREFAPGKPLTVVLNHQDNSQDRIQAEHSYSQKQIEWFKAGSALNFIRKLNRQ